MRCAARGLTVKTFDRLIAAYALAHDTQLLTVDSGFGLMETKGIRLHLVPLIS
jgi:predicted nucleic acid-binding protein